MKMPIAMSRLWKWSNLGNGVIIRVMVSGAVAVNVDKEERWVEGGGGEREKRRKREDGV